MNEDPDDVRRRAPGGLIDAFLEQASEWVALRERAAAAASAARGESASGGPRAGLVEGGLLCASLGLMCATRALRLCVSERAFVRAAAARGQDSARMGRHEPCEVRR
jgi:hypothetical protein